MNVCLIIPFPSTQIASLAYDVLSVDKELKRSGVQRKIEIDGTNIIINLHGEELKKLRVAANAFIKNVKLIVKTVDLFTSEE